MTAPPTHLAGALRCETCGYDLAGLDEDALCPECARPLRDSLTHRRPGSPWQRDPGLGSWMSTTAALLAAPRAFWDDVRVEDWRSWNLMNVNALAVSCMPLLAALVFGEAPAGIVAWLMTFVGLFIALMITMAIVRVGRGVRGDVAQVAVAHASGLLVAGALVFFALVLLRLPNLALFTLPATALSMLTFAWIGAGRLRHVQFQSHWSSERTVN